MTAASAAIEAVLDMLEDAGIEATRDAGAFNPAPAGVLVGLPTLADRLLSGAGIFELPVLVVSADPLNTPAAVDRVYAIADSIVRVCDGATYRPATFGGRAGAEPLPALEVTVSITAQEV
jgi:hypothetical protein